MIYNKTCLFSATAGTNSITLSEPLSAFERYVVKVNPGVYWESVCTADRSVQRYNRYGSYSNDGYMEWPANWVISNGTKQMDCNRFQLLMQLGTANKSQTFGWNNTAGNIKNIMEVWGINHKDYVTAYGEGKPEGDWKAYNETLLWSGTDYANQSHITLNNRAIGYERLKVGVGSFGESTNIYDVDAPQNYTAWLPLRSYWGTTTGSFYLSMHRYQWDNETSGLSAVSGKTWQLGTGAANPYSAAGNYTATDTFVRRPVWAIWGVNEKDKHLLVPGSMTGGTISANRNSGYEHDITTVTVIPSSEEWKCSAINLTGATLTGNSFMFGDSNVTAQAEFEHSKNLTLVNNEHATISADKMTGFSGDIVTVDTASIDEGWYFTGLNVTGATATGNQFMFVGENVTAEGLYTDEGYPITYLSDEHVSVTGDSIYIPGSEGITLDSGYDTYYRISGYDITGGSIVNGKLVPTGPCTIKAVQKVNYFTASGRWLLPYTTTGTASKLDLTEVSLCQYKTNNVPSNFLVAATAAGNGVSRSTNSAWRGGACSGYKLSFAAISHSYNRGSSITGGCTGATYAGSTKINGVTAGGSYKWEGTVTIPAGNTTTTGLFKASFTGKGNGNKFADVNTGTTWTATGILP